MGGIGSRLVAGALVAISIGTAALAGSSATAQPGQDTAAVEAGRGLFLRCNACHSVKASSRALTGPHLEGIVGRPVAAVPGFPYSAMLKDKSFVWTKDRLELWLRKPQKDFPGLCIPFTGLPRKADREALIAYLEHPES